MPKKFTSKEKRFSTYIIQSRHIFAHRETRMHMIMSYYILKYFLPISFYGHYFLTYDLMSKTKKILQNQILFCFELRKTSEKLWILHTLFLSMCLDSWALAIKII